MRYRLLAAALMAAALALTACSDSNPGDSPGFVHIEEGGAETQAAQTAAARATATAAGAPTRTPVPTGTPYVIPANAPDYDGDTVITRVGREEITLDEYRQRVRFERFVPLYKLLKSVERGGAQVLDLSREDNWYVGAVFATLADSYSLGAQTQRILVIEAIATQEAQRRGMAISPQQFDAKLAEYLGVQLGANGQLPAGFETRYAEFLEGIHTYAGMTEEEFRRIVRAQALYSQLQAVISNQPAAIAASRELATAREVEDMLLAEQAEAETIAERLRGGERLAAIAASLGYQSSGPDATRVLRRSDASLPADVMNAVFSARPGDVVGPIETPRGWYVARVRQEVSDMLSPEQVQEVRRSYFLDWIEAQMDDAAYVEDYRNWIGQTPQEPLPRDVSPLFRDENITLPGSLLGELTAAPAATPAD